jgi:3-oxoacyl-[acyl-carrier-protein] synthase III
MKGIKIIGYGHALPKHQVSNHDLSQIMETNHDWIVERTGIETRYFSKDEYTSDLGTRAARKAIEQAGIDPLSIDLILCATITPDAMMPATAALIQGKLGISGAKALAFDVNVACSGFIVALQTAQAYLNAHMAKRILIVGAETLSRMLDFSDRGSAILFGDGAGALIVEASDTQSYHLAYTEYDDAQSLTNDVTPLNADMKAQVFKGYLRMKGQAVFRFAVGALEHSIKELLQTSQFSIEDIDWIVSHQANLRILQHVAHKLKIPPERFYTNLQQVGNTSSASIPLALSMMKDEGLLKEGQKMICIGFGAGLSYAASLIEL